MLMGTPASAGSTSIEASVPSTEMRWPTVGVVGFLPLPMPRAPQPPNRPMATSAIPIRFIALSLLLRRRFLDRVHAKRAGHLGGARADRFRDFLILRHCGENAGGVPRLIELQMRESAHLARASEPGIAWHCKRLQPVDDRFGRKLVELEGGHPDGGEIAIGRRQILVVG